VVSLDVRKKFVPFTEKEITMAFMAWPEIEGFHNIRKFVRVDPGEWFRAMELLHGTSTVHYRAKVKLHGTNAAVQLHEKGEIVCQSRESIITPEKDNAGFARWVMTNKEKWNRAIDKAYVASYGGWIIYGEWCGPGIQKNVAVAEVTKKFFAVFAARPLDGSDTLIVEPEDLQNLVGGIPDVYVLPWYEKDIDINWRQTDEDLTKSTTEISDWVLAVEANDPWVEATFGNKGTGEGLVFYPTSTAHLGWQTFQNLVFKAKGDKHKNIKTAAPAQVNPEVAASVDAFCDLVLTQARLEQGARALLGEHKHSETLQCLFCTTGALTPECFDMKNLGKFIAWISGDVQKETQDELEASGLTWKQVQKPLTDKAREWYKAKAK
jgi:hypothetical protein